MLPRSLVQLFSSELSHFATYLQIYPIVHVSNTCRWLAVPTAAYSRVSFFFALFNFTFPSPFYLSIFLYLLLLPFFLRLIRYFYISSTETHFFFSHFSLLSLIRRSDTLSCSVMCQGIECFVFPWHTSLLFIEALLSHSDTPHSVEFLWTSDRSDAEISV
jgi:hypothetical protein